MLYYQIEKNDKYDCTVVDVHKVFRNHKYIQNKNVLPQKYRLAYQFPYQYECAFSRWLTALSYKRAMKDIDEFDFVWIGGPELIHYIPKKYRGKLLYDCMDNYENFTSKQSRKKKIRIKEKECLERAEVVLATSDWLCERIKAFKEDCNPVLVRNAYDGKMIYPIKPVMKRKEYKIGFIGAIAQWVDVDLMINSIGALDNICYHLVGPCNQRKEGYDRLIYEGSREHADLYDTIADYDCLVMPFLINELTKAVDPVKLYEYISFGKCIIASYYEEIERFSPFVYFYHNEEEYIELIRKLSEEGFPPKYTEAEQRSFLQENTWEKRFKLVDEILSEYC